MRLLLTSAGWDKNRRIGREFLKLVGKPPAKIKIFLVVEDSKYLKRGDYIINFLSRIGITMKNVSIFLLDRKIEKKDLENIDVIYVWGGNTFKYLNGIRKTGLDRRIVEFVKKGGVYLGLSAGSYIVCPTIEAAAWKHADRNTIKLKNLKGLNLVPFLITAHFKEKYRKIIEAAAKKTKRTIIALTDRQAILVKGKKIKIIGPGKKIVLNKKYAASVF